jgi:predicted membrane protein
MILIRLFKQMAIGRELFMKNSIEKVLWGIILVLFGAILAGRALGILDFNVFFPGWWTLFIIVPSAISLLSGKDISSSIGGLAIGIMLLMTQTGAIDWQEFVKLLIAVILVTMGFSFLFPGSKNQKRAERKERKNNKDYSKTHYYNKEHSFNPYRDEQDRKEQMYEAKSQPETRNMRADDSEKIEAAYKEDSGEMNQKYREALKEEPNSYRQDNEVDLSKANGDNAKSNHYEDRNRQSNVFRQYTGFFSVQKDQYLDEVFGGAVINAILGGVELDLRNAVFLNDTIIDITCIMGGVDIFVPTNMKVVINCTPIMGGVECYVKNYNNQSQNQYTLFIKGTCLMGGVEIK